MAILPDSTCHEDNIHIIYMPSIPVIMSLPSPALKTKEAHLAAIREIEKQEARLRQEIDEKKSERKTLQMVLDAMHQKPNGTSRKR